MITTLYFLQFIAFYLWQITASKRSPKGRWEPYILKNKSLIRPLGAALALVIGFGFVCQWGLASGLVGFWVGLMAVGCLSVVIEPFHYVRVPSVIAIYVGCVLLELTI